VARPCLFCPNPATTKEHLWGDWILKGLHRTNPIQATIGKSAPREFHGDVRMRCACHQCNHGWMSTLETTVQPFVGALIRDIPVTLTIEQEKTISLWVVKTAMVLEGAITHRPRFYSRTECEQLRLASVITDRSLMWLGRISQSGLFASGTYIWLQDNFDKTNDGYVATFVVCHLAIQVLTIRIGPQDHLKTVRTVCRDGPWDDSLLGIYPANQAVSWPPRLTFAVGGPLFFTALRDRWSIGRKM
jgi:hypothetical protein